MKIYDSGIVTSSCEISDRIFSVSITTKIASQAVPGQFVMIYPKDKATILPRPISICETSGDTIRLVYRVVGNGTKEFSFYKEGEQVKLLGPIGNGFPAEACAGKRAILIGGGIGVPPMLELSKAVCGVAAETTAVLGYRNADLFLKKDFDKYVKTVIATDDGSVGIHGTVIDAIEAMDIKADVIYACGPMPMLKAVKAYAAQNDIQAYISLEERMACGVGACLGCVCKTTHKDGHSHVNNARVCTEGPVFDAREVEI